MRKSAFLASAALALALGAAPAVAQNTTQDNNKDQPPRSETQRDRNSSAPQQSQQSNTGQNTNPAKSSSDQAQQAPVDSPRNAQSERDNSRNAQRDRDNSQQRNRSATDRAQPDNGAQQRSTQSAPSNAAPAQTNANRNDRQNSDANNTNAAQAPSAQRASASLDPQRKERLSAAIGRLDARPLSRVDFSVSVGTVVPSHVSLRPLPTTIVEIVPQYRGYDFFVVRDEVVIVEPRTHKIVDVIERSGPSHARAETRERVKLSDKQREVIRKHVSSRRATTGSSRREVEIEVGRQLPDTVEIETFPEEVYREVPAIRSYRYIDRGGDIYLVDPSDRAVIEEIR